MYFAGVDIGSVGAKALIFNDNEIASYFIGKTGPDSTATCWMAYRECLAKAGLNEKDISYVVATGYGRVSAPFADGNVSEISCHARGAHWMAPSVRTILDMGGQDCKAINCDDHGRVTKFVMNDKCAGGTGRFLETIAVVLGVSLDDIGRMSMQSTKKVEFSTVCAVFAKSEALGLLRKGVAKADILAGLNDAIAGRAVGQLKRVSIEKDFAVTGGIAKNAGLTAKIEERLGMKRVSMQPDPQIAGALGAALFARERWLKKQEKEATAASCVRVDSA